MRTHWKGRDESTRREAGDEIYINDKGVIEPEEEYYFTNDGDEWDKLQGEGMIVMEE